MTIQAKLDSAFAEVNKKMLDRQLEWAKSRKEAEKLAKTTKEKIEACGSKQWYNILWGRNWEMIVPLVEKNVAAIIAKRDANIIKALSKKSITEISDFDLVYFGDGYEGTFYVDGHRITIRTIIAGGYNIQCLHQRTLVKIS